MKHPQIVIFESDGSLARALAEPAEERRWLRRESRQFPACLSLLRDGGPSVLVVRLGRNLIREFTLLDEVHSLLPEVPVIFVGNAVDAAVHSLAYDLGAAYVLVPPEPRQNLAGIVIQAMSAAIERFAASHVLADGPPSDPWRSLHDGSAASE